MKKEIIKLVKEIDNPYPKWLFPMTTKDYVKAIPDPKLRTAISGCIGRWVWNNAIGLILDRINEELDD